MTIPHYEVFALRYARFSDRTQGDNLILPDDHSAPMPLDFFVWVIRGGGRTIVVDTGFAKQAPHGGAAPGSAPQSQRCGASAWMRRA